MQLARRTMTIAAASLADADGIKASVASSLTAVAYSGVALDGAIGGTPNLGGFTELASYPTVTTAGAGAFDVGSTITFVGTYGGLPREEVLTLTSTDGETLTSSVPFDEVTEIRVDAQADDDGTLIFGWTDICPRKAGHFLRSWWLVGGGTGNIVVGYPTGNDTLVSAAGREHPALVSRILAATAVTVTVYEL